MFSSHAQRTWILAANAVDGETIGNLNIPAVLEYRVKTKKDLGLGAPMMRAIDKGLAASKIGLVLVTPALLARLPKEGIADKELSALLQSNRLVPIVHGTTYTALRDVSPMFASRSGLDTSEDTMEVIATKIAELVTIWN